MLAATLADDGHDVREAANGIDALDISRSWRPDLVIVDLVMPVMNGWQFAEAYAAQPFAHQAPIVAMTAAGPAAVRSAEGLPSVSAVLPKPLDLAELHDLVDFSLTAGAP